MVSETDFEWEIMSNHWGKFCW